jgi:hypothetical protein
MMAMGATVPHFPDEETFLSPEKSGFMTETNAPSAGLAIEARGDMKACMPPSREPSPALFFQTINAFMPEW